MSQDQEDNQGMRSDQSPMISHFCNYRYVVLYVCSFGAEAMDSVVGVVNELGRDDEVAIKMTQHKVYKRKNILF